MLAQTSRQNNGFSQLFPSPVRCCPYSSMIVGFFPPEKKEKRLKNNLTLFYKII